MRVVGIIVIAFGLTAVASAGPVELTPVSSIEDLFALPPEPATALLSQHVLTSTLSADVLSQVYFDGSLYAYLYQVQVREGSSHPVQLFTVGEFLGADAATQMGYITGPSPEGFCDLDKVAPESTGAVSGQQVVSFYYTARFGNELEPGFNTSVLYILSDHGPDLIDGSVINSTTGTAAVYGAIPEPVTLSLLAAAGLALVSRRRYRTL